MGKAVPSCGLSCEPHSGCRSGGHFEMGEISFKDIAEGITQVHPPRDGWSEAVWGR